MELILFYGPGEISKRNESLRLRKSFGDSVKIIDTKHNDLTSLEMELVSHSLFETGPRLVVVENAPDSLDLEKLKGDENITLLLLSGNLKSDAVLLKSAIKLKAKIIPFEGEKEISAFAFLDALIEGKKQAFVELDKLLDGYGGMYVLTMTYYLLRRNFLPQASSFMQNKVKSQKQRYTEEDWSKLYKLILQSEFAIKNGSGSEQLILTNLVQTISLKDF